MQVDRKIRSVVTMAVYAGAENDSFIGEGWLVKKRIEVHANALVLNFSGAGIGTSLSVRAVGKFGPNTESGIDPVTGGLAVYAAHKTAGETS